MIIPCPENLSPKDFVKYPLTMTLVVLNIFIFFLIFSGPASKMESSKILETDGMITTGRLYYQYLQKLSPTALAEKPDWAHRLQSSNIEQMTLLGAYALRDATFLEKAEKLPFHGDQVQIASWRTEVESFRNEYKQQLLFRFGLSSLEKGPLSWITYQFSHSTVVHLLSNILFLIVVGAAVEALAGSGILLVVYILGGVAGGLGFLISQTHGTVPMVGASASISALLAFYCVAQVKPRIRYFYFISPIAGYFGFIFLPTLLFFPLFLVVDVANLMATPEGLGSGIAYAAHLGGTVFGLLFGLGYRRGLMTHSAILTKP
ncbi:MAG: rhomboid family intramembrane serine protease [Bacillota bacterium]